jgi:hypothetical protein
MFGLTFKYDINDRVAIKTSFAYELGNGCTKESSSYLDYLTLPVFLQVKFGKKPEFFIIIGPYVSYLFASNSNDLDNKVFDIGSSMGIGAQIPLSSEVDINFELRNNIGFINIQNNMAYYDHHGNLITGSASPQ